MAWIERMHEPAGRDHVDVAAGPKSASADLIKAVAAGVGQEALARRQT